MKTRLSALLLLLLAVTPALPALAQDAKRGEHVFRRCLLCHVIDPNKTNALAPPLHNVIGRPAASITGFQYSEIMRQAGNQGLVWSSEALFYFLDRPDVFMPGTYMAFAGLEEPERLDVIAYLEKISREFQNPAARKPPTSPPPKRGTSTSPSTRPVTAPPAPTPAAAAPAKPGR